MDPTAAPPPTIPEPTTLEPDKTAVSWGGTFWRASRYISSRLVILLITAVISVWVTIIAANLGGYVDEIQRRQIEEAISMSTRPDPDQTPEERIATLRATIEAAQDAAGLNDPFLLRTLYWLTPALTLDLGRSQRGIRSITTLGPERFDVRQLIVERIPATLLLFGVTNIAIFFISIGLALRISRQRGNWLDKLIVLLSPTSAAPSWFYGLLLIAIFAAGMGILPFGGMVPSPPPESRLIYYYEMARHMVLPFAAVFLSAFFQSVYIWRTFFLIYANEDYVEMAQAKGLSEKQIARTYLLRPTLPPIITGFALVVISAWSGSVILETIFNWPGLGALFFLAIQRFDIAVIVGLTVVYAYFLALTIFILDISYMLVDPRVKLGSQGQSQTKTAVTTQAGEHPIRTRLKTAVYTTLTSLRTLFSWNTLKATGRDLGQMLLGLPQVARGLGRGLSQVARYPSGFMGLTIILILLGSVAYTLIAIPYDDAVAQWRGTTDLSEQPRHARPAWISSLTGVNYSRTMVLNTADSSATKERETFGNVEAAILTYTFDYNYDTFPSGLALFFDSTAQSNRPHLDLTWHTPDGRDIRITTITPSSNQIYRFDQDDRLVRRLDGRSPYQGLFADPQAEELVPLNGTYQLIIDGLIFEEESDIDAKLVIYGEVFGWAGTDNQRRDLSIALLWGTPTALAFGFLAAVLTTFFTMIIAGTGVWFGGWVDGLIQRITEINLAIPVFPILAMITLFYTLSIWYLLALAVLFGIFGSAIKTYRAIFLQVRESAYIEAAEAYGAGSLRIIFFYLIPRIAPVLLPQMVVLVPYYVFLEAGIAFLGLSDPLMPTWGKLINEAHTQSALLNGHYHWILQPAVLLMVTALAFALVGFALDRVFNPRLKEV